MSKLFVRVPSKRPGRAWPWALAALLYGVGMLLAVGSVRSPYVDGNPDPVCSSCHTTRVNGEFIHGSLPAPSMHTARRGHG